MSTVIPEAFLFRGIWKWRLKKQQNAVRFFFKKKKYSGKVNTPSTFDSITPLYNLVDTFGVALEIPQKGADAIFTPGAVNVHSPDEAGEQFPSSVTMGHDGWS